VHVVGLDGGHAVPVRIHGLGPIAAAWSPDGTRLALACRDRRVSLWHEGAYEAEELAGHRAEVVSLAFSPDGRRLATTGDDGQVILRSAATGRRTAVFPAFLLTA
jgi:WD40 repeat protein